MGDHRADIKIEFIMHGKTYKMDSWINWFPEGDGGIDQRVVDFFRESWDDAKARYDVRVEKYFEKERARETEAAERMELERLQTKYPSPSLR